MTLFDFQIYQASFYIYAGEIGFFFEFCLIFVDNLEPLLCWTGVTVVSLKKT